MAETRTNSFFRICLGLMIAIAIVFIFYLRLEFNELNARKAELVSSVEEIRENIDSIKTDLASDLDEEYVIRFAREKLNLRLPSEIIFYNDLTD